VGLVSAIFRNILGKPGAADFRDSAEHFVSVLREHGIALTFARDELRYVDDLADRLAKHHEYRDALGCWLGELLVRNFAGEWVPGHALGPAVRVVTKDMGTRHLFPVGWVYRRADGGEAESIAGRLHRELGYPDPQHLGRFTDTGERA
jgi:hypothetical protein